MRDGFVLVWLGMVSVIVAVGVGMWLENARARHERQAAAADAAAKTAEQEAWDDFWQSVVRDNYTAAELTRLYMITKAVQ